jgi:hypothetical protein
VKYSGGVREWWVNGKKHREGKPAIKRPNGDSIWYYEGKFHRDDGPAIELMDGSKAWYSHGANYTEVEYWRSKEKVHKL